jgi:hypothetical protein
MSAPLTVHESALLAAALDYAARGWAVLPLRGKVPALAHGLRDATTDPDRVRLWWSAEHRGCNVGIVAPADVLILDVDTPHGHAAEADGAAALAALESAHGDLPDTPRATTGGGGEHLWFKLPEGVRHGNERGALPAGLDVRGGGRGYVVAPPSVHPDTGAAYRWQTYRAPDHVALAELPAWLLSIVQAGATARHYAEGDGRTAAPTDMHPVVLRVLDAAGLHGEVKRGPQGGVIAFVLSRCPACGDTRGKCRVTPAGRLKSWRERDCPAGPTRAGNHGIDLAEWVDLYAPEGAAGFATPAPSPDPSQEVNAGPIDAAELPDALDVRDPAAALDVDTLADALRDTAANGVALFVVPPGVGKSRAALQLAAEHAAGGARVLYLAANHALAAELADRLRVLSPGIEPVHLRGMAGLCELPGRDRPHAAAIARAAETMGRRMCEGCPLASRCGGTCEGWTPPRVRRGSVTFAAHAGAAAYMADLDAADLVIVDELPDLVRVRETGPAHLETLRSGSLAARRWYRENPGHGDFSRELAAVAAALDAETPRGIYAERRAVTDVLDALRGRPAAMTAARAVLAEGADVLDALPPMPTPADARRGAADRWPDAGAWTFVRAIARALSDPAAAPAATVLRLDAGAPGSGWAFETRHLYELPAGARVLALDATGADTVAEWQSIAERRGGALDFTTRAAIGEAPAAAEHYRTERLRTARLWARTGRGVYFLADALGAVKNALLRAAGPVPCALGILTHKPLADALRWGANLVIDPAADPPPGAAFAADDVHALEIAELAAELVNRRWKLEIGHYGRDTRGTTRFEDVDVLAVLGAPRGDYGATVADAAAIGIDAAELAADRTRAETIQAVARARHLRRAPDRRVRLFLATDDDAPTGVELPGVAWTTTLADRSNAPTLARIDAAREIAAWADRAGCLDVRAMLAALVPHAVDVSERVARRLARAEADRRGWAETREGEAHRLVYRADGAACPVMVETPEPNEIRHFGTSGEPRVVASDLNNRRGAPPPMPPATPAPPYHAATRGPQPAETPGERPASAATVAGPVPFDPPDEWGDAPPLPEYAGPPLDAENDDGPTPGELAEWARMRAAG